MVEGCGLEGDVVLFLIQLSVNFVLFLGDIRLLFRGEESCFLNLSYLEKSRS